MHALVRGTVEEGRNEEGVWLIVTLAQCPKCTSALVAVQEEYEADHEEKPTRVWPAPGTQLSWQIPAEIRKALEEAQKCLKCKAYTASVAMSGRALEAVGRHFHPNETKPLLMKEGLTKLLDAKVIDSRLYEWGNALRDERNLAAHPSGTHFKREDAEDIFKFSTNICEYVFILSAQFEDFDKRRKKAAGSQ